MSEAAAHTPDRWHRVEDLPSCKLLADRAILKVLAEFTGRENTIARAAAVLGEGITPLYKLVRRCERLGLLHAVRSEARAGRAVRHYRTVADAFFIPFRAYPPEHISGQNWATHQALFRRGLERLYHEERFVEQDWGVLTSIAPNGSVYLQITSSTGTAWAELMEHGPAVVSGWHTVYLDSEDAKALQHELDEVLARYLRKTGAHRYLLGAFLTDVDGLG